MADVTEEKVVEWLSRHSDPSEVIKRALDKHRSTKEQREKLLEWLESHPDHPYVW